MHLRGCMPGKDMHRPLHLNFPIQTMGFAHTQSGASFHTYHNILHSHQLFVYMKGTRMRQNCLLGSTVGFDFDFGDYQHGK